MTSLFAIYRTEGRHPGGGGGGGNSPTLSKAILMQMFSDFFGGRNPFDQFFGRNGGMGEDMETDDPFASFGMVGWAVSPALLTHAVTAGDWRKNRTLR